MKILKKDRFLSKSSSFLASLFVLNVLCLVSFWGFLLLFCGVVVVPSTSYPYPFVALGIWGLLCLLRRLRLRLRLFCVFCRCIVLCVFFRFCVVFRRLNRFLRCIFRLFSVFLFRSFRRLFLVFRICSCMTRSCLSWRWLF